jgi:hypothetical protein
MFCFLTINYSDGFTPRDIQSNSETAKTNITNDRLVSDWNADSESIITTSIIVFEVIVLFFVILYWKRTKSENSNKTNTNYKRNIRAIRKEEAGSIFRLKVNKNRKKLSEKLNLKELNSKNINHRARKMSIGKGEILLAAKINQINSFNK